MIRAPNSLALLVGPRLREARLNARLTVREVAAQATSLTHTTLVRYENSEVVPSFDRLEQLAHIYRVPVVLFILDNPAVAPLIEQLADASPAEVQALLELVHTLRQTS